MGLPVVTCDTVGCRESVVPNQTGYLVPPRDGQALATAIAALVSDPSLRKSMGNAGRIFMQERFEVSNLVDSMVLDMEDVL